MNELTYIERSPETVTIVERIMDRFAGDSDAILSNLAANGIVFGKPCTPTTPETTPPAPVETAEPKEWIEHQEAERRAWAVSTAIEHIRRWDTVERQDVISFAKELVEYVKGENPDLNDVEATDTFYLVMAEKLAKAIEDDDIEQFLIDCVDTLAKHGVRLKDGKKLEVEG